MSFLVAAVVLVGALGLVNLNLTLGLARRMRQYAELLSGLRPAEVGGSTRPAGSAVAAFSAIAVDGTPIDESWFSAPTLVGFFSPGCPACHDLLPAFVAAAANERALAVVEDGNAPAEEYVAPLAEVTTVLVGDEAQQAVAAFAVRGYPAVCAVDARGVISATGVHLVRPGERIAR